MNSCLETGEDFVHTSASRFTLACSVGDVKPSGARVRGSVARIASGEEMNLMKPIDEPTLGVGSESPGRNASEPTGGLDNK